MYALRTRAVSWRLAAVHGRRRAALSSEAERALLEARQVRAKRASTPSVASGSKGGSSSGSAAGSGGDSKVYHYLAGVVAVLGGVFWAAVEVKSNPKGTLGTVYKDSWLETTISNLNSDINSVYQPQAGDKLIPDFESCPFYGQVPPGSLAPPLLVLDLEKTLIGSEYDAKYGWRHVKRPGLQKFLDRMSQYFEIVILSENDLNPDILAAIDPEGKCHKHGPQAMEVRNGIMLKRLDMMNRDLSRIVLLDDDEAAASLYPRNTLLVRPFENVNDTRDTALEDVMLLLQALVHDGVNDFRICFDDLGTREAEEAVIEYKMRVAAAKQRERTKRERGLGFLLKAQSGADANDAELMDQKSGSVLSRIVGAAPEDLVGGSGRADSRNKSAVTAAVSAGLKGVVAPPTADKEKQPAAKKKGAIFQWLEDSDAEKARLDELKIQRMNEIHARKMKEREEQAARRAKGTGPDSL